MKGLFYRATGRSGKFSRKTEEGNARPSGAPLKASTFNGPLTYLSRRLSGSVGKIVSNQPGARLVIQDIPNKEIAVFGGVTKTPTDSSNTPVSKRSSVEEASKLRTDLGNETAELVMSIAKKFAPLSNNVDIPTLSESTVAFCGRSAPGVSLQSYISRLVRNINHAFDVEGNGLDSIGVRCLLIGVIYIRRLMEHDSTFEINALNVHRLFFVSMTDALKVNEDEHPDNKYMAVVGGVDTNQLNTLEAAFCTHADFRFIVTLDEIQRVCDEFSKTKHVFSVPKNISLYPIRRVSWECTRN